MEILDCTLRDGGYLNNWDFDRVFAQKLVEALSDALIDIIEVGFVYPEGSGGYFKTINDDKINFLLENVRVRPKIAVMIDYQKCPFSLKASNETPIDIVRIAAHKKDIYNAIDLSYMAYHQGYESSIQMMNFPSYTLEEYINVIEYAILYKVKYLYIADSFGSMFPESVVTPIALMRIMGIDSGFHAHNNIELAFSNSREAIEAGVSVVDSTLLGMGRGAGNLKTELLLTYLTQNKRIKYNLSPILSFIDRYDHYLRQFSNKMSTEFILSGMFNKHPNDVIREA